jgi:hypothetical protein
VKDLVRHEQRGVPLAEAAGAIAPLVQKGPAA